MNALTSVSREAAARRRAIDILYKSQASHLASSMSMIEMLTAVYESIDVDKIKVKDPGRDRVIQSKGHAAAATYAVMEQFGIIEAQIVDTYHQDGSKLAGLVSHAVPGIEHSTGSLGHGLSVAVGAAIGLRSGGFHDARVFVLLGDGEMHEGSNWEALMLANHHRLHNLVVLIDNNGISMITRTNDVIDMRPLSNRFEGFGFATYVVDGKSVSAIRSAIDDAAEKRRHSVIICNTVKGQGVAFAENDPLWHYRSLNAETYQRAIDGLPENR
jgi:transketolase